ncbi:MAG TPA: prolipoprotein diacylglyceryl transferase family protein [Lacipirellulaceae bacterium]|jgi:phosphatidylglycerol:prolipoprotein diacylglycerol transferase|nr:prolipoprotein diacylglyceryl transferase family protein [Lacipirellulaceae bacterium]
MCSELFRIPYTWNGVPIFGVGVLLAIWAVVAVATLVGLVRRNGWTADTLSSLPVLLLLGAAILYLPRVFPEGLPIRGYGVMLLIGITSGVGMAMYRGRKGGLDPEIIISLAIWMVVCGVIGARLFYVIEYWHESFAGRNFRDTLLEIANIPEGGLVIFGGFIGAMIGFFTLLRKQRLPLLAMADLIAPSMAIGLAFGRVGCLLNGCCYGGQTDLPWHVAFPKLSSRYEIAKANDAQRFSPPYADQASHGEMHGFRVDEQGDKPAVVTRVDPGSPAESAGLRVNDSIAAINGAKITFTRDAKSQLFELFLAQQPLHIVLDSGKSLEVASVPLPDRSRPVHPAQLYSAIDAGLLGWLLWAYYPFRRRDGELIALLLTIHPITRFLLEIIRTDEPAVFGTGMSISQNVSLGLLACGMAIWWYLSRQPRGVIWPLATPPKSMPSTGRRRQPARA